MAEALVSLVVKQLGSIMASELEQEVRLVVGVEKEVDKMTSNLTAIQAVIADAETKQVKEASIRDWLEKLKDVAYDIEDVLDDWEAEILSSQTKSGDDLDPKPEKKVRSFLQPSCFCCKQVGLRRRHDIANKLIELNERLDLIAQEKERYKFVKTEGNPQIERPLSISMIDATEVKGRDQDKNVLVNMLLNDPSNDGDRPDLHVISILGLGGIGKTTLAQIVFNDDRIKSCFEKKIWVCVSSHFDETRVVEAIYESLLGRTPDVKHGLIEKIGELIQGKKFLLVLDDVWEENPTKWNQLKQSLRLGSPGSKVLVTTRKENVALVMCCFKKDILKVGILSDEECWLIASKMAFFDRSDIDCKDLEGIGREISKKCKGLPLAAKALGGILQFRKTREEWQSILESEIWEEVEEAQRDVIAPLWLSYYDLSPKLKRCFSYCAIFPKDYRIKRSELIGLWMAQGYLKEGQCDDLEIIGENYFQQLIMRSFFQDFEKDEYDSESIQWCKMHDIVHDFVQIVARNECVGVQVNGAGESITGSLSSKVHHLSVDFANSRSSFNSFDGIKKLRSLLLWGPAYGRLPHTTEELSRLLTELTHVRSLSFRDSDFAEIPSSISKLVHLKWLDLSNNNNLMQLPERLCELHNLQTIDVTECCNLELPLGIGKLINLRHLRNWCNAGGGPTRLPKGIARLIGLKTLEMVDVGCNGDAFSLGDLKNLHKLRGKLIISNLGAYNDHVGEAKEAELKKKEHLTNLVLVFTLEQHTLWSEELLEGLEPSPYLGHLLIVHYGGTTFPSWMISLKNLRHVGLSMCESCEHLPLLGKLPSLETLVLGEMSAVKKVGLEFLGIETQIGESNSDIAASSSSSPVVAFPNLTKLEFHRMYSWEEWDDYYDGTIKHHAIIIMPSLISLDIFGCPRLKALPDYIMQNTMLYTLEIKGSDLLSERYNKEKGEDWSKISHISHVKII